MSNIVFIPNIDLGKSQERQESNTQVYQYSIDSWKSWCDKNDCELLVWEDLLYPIDYMKITWQRYYLFDILDGNNIDYDQVLMVDADTIVHTDCPNFFEETEGKYCGVMNNGDYEWVLRSIRGFGDKLFDGMRIHPWTYINGGFQILNSKHKEFFETMKSYYLENESKIQQTIDEVKASTDQTILNYMLVKNNVDVKILPECYNLVDMVRKNLLYTDERCWWTDELHFLRAGWVYHFNAIPVNSLSRHTSYWMERTYKELYG